MSSSVANRKRAAGISLAALSFVLGCAPALHGQGFGKIVGAVTDLQRSSIPAITMQADHSAPGTDRAQIAELETGDRFVLVSTFRMQALTLGQAFSMTSGVRRFVSTSTDC
jgi:hypothetical protein